MFEVIKNPFSFHAEGRERERQFSIFSQLKFLTQFAALIFNFLTRKRQSRSEHMCNAHKDTNK